MQYKHDWNICLIVSILNRQLPSSTQIQGERVKKQIIWQNLNKSTKNKSFSFIFSAIAAEISRHKITHFHVKMVKRSKITKFLVKILITIFQELKSAQQILISGEFSQHNYILTNTAMQRSNATIGAIHEVWRAFLRRHVDPP